MVGHDLGQLIDPTAEFVDHDQRSLTAAAAISPQARPGIAVSTISALRWLAGRLGEL
jgi:hypothetical protein